MSLRFRADLPPDVVSRLVALTRPRVACGGPYHPSPFPKQQAFLTLPGREGMFGGSAGPGKSSALLMAALQYVCVPGYRALLFRRTFPQLEGDDGLIAKAKAWLAPHMQSGLVQYHEGRHRFTFPSGATITLGFLRTDNDRLRYQGLAFQFAGFDEMTEWPNAKAYLFVGFSRVRRPAVPCASCSTSLRRAHPTLPWVHAEATRCPTPIPSIIPAACPGCGWTLADVPLRTRTASNPGGPGHSWVAARYLAHPSTPDRFYLPALIVDNPAIDAVSYVAGLDELDPVTRARLLRGDWNVREAGRMFNRDWILGAAA